MVDLEDYNMNLEVYAWSFVVKRLHHILLYNLYWIIKKDSPDPKVDVKPPFAMLHLAWPNSIFSRISMEF
jgi:hypothetical protein